MTHSLRLTIIFFILLYFTRCGGPHSENQNDNTSDTSANEATINLLTDISPTDDNGVVNAVIEIPAGTLEKWELNKSTGKMELEMIDGKPRIINYLGYPGNYGMIPQTLLSIEQGGDGDPLDVLVLGPPVERGSIMKCKIIGVLLLLDRGEQDDKLVAVSTNSKFYHLNDIEQLKSEYPGVHEIIELWFTNYKGPGLMQSNGYGTKKQAMEILTSAIAEYD